MFSIYFHPICHCYSILCKSGNHNYSFMTVFCNTCLRVVLLFLSKNMQSEVVFEWQLPVHVHNATPWVHHPCQCWLGPTQKNVAWTKQLGPEDWVLNVCWYTALLGCYFNSNICKVFTQAHSEGSISCMLIRKLSVKTWQWPIQSV